MAIKPTCDKCGKELKKFGAILFGPPTKGHTVRKFHICTDCYRVLVREMKK